MAIGTPVSPAETPDQRVERLRAGSGELDALLRRYGRPGAALRHYGLVQWQRMALDDAVAAFQAALAFEPENADLLRDLSSVHDAAGDVATAESYIRDSLCHDRDAARSWLILANLTSRSDRLEEADAAFGRAVLLDPTLGDAHFGLGLLRFRQRRFAESIESLGRAVGHGYATEVGFTALGHVQYLAGEFAACSGSFEAAMRFGPLDVGARRKYARARTLLTIVAGDLGRAISDYPVLAGEHPEDITDVLRDGFSQLSAYGHREAALAVGRFRLAQTPDDPMQRYLLDAVSGSPLDRAPVDYLEYYFDRFAETFDQKLVDILHYDAPAMMARLVAGIRGNFHEIVDLGCGTGLAAAHLKAFGGRITGVDVAARMLDEAAKRGLYADLVKAEAVDFLGQHQGTLDLIFAADVLVYFGDLEPLFGAAARALAPGGLFALSIETAASRDYDVLPSGRFAHTAAYLDRVAAPCFSVAARQHAPIRLEAGKPAEGMLLVLQRLPIADIRELPSHPAQKA